MNTSVRKGFLGVTALLLGVTVAIPGVALAGMKMASHKPVAHKVAAHKVVGNAHVEAIQRALDKSGAHLKVDGILGRETETALRIYQKKHGLKMTGSADEATLKLLKVK
ncbi:peptidoglycan-binding domain-containing protein [Acidiferrobacter thiooxydans]|jgi:peptidoglycan hydrolase-like protein with peptidoglycan-binding domain|uniref:Peptidoglycan-binding protein n=1 Tax=Acidiferrobacter thiooxydans TaxID=163359 RepID=A0A1C2G4K1_9GAMM|nr:peptidoglycan-binding domain-containing protein [Acidiferrobacter thiooxydans]RCN55913.1 peptidoglycan-binding protein [Acidiferrobacter thiooxydans]UEN98832.1 peptidoglycan-binding protein [Acidiferrobacter thiooxydans]